MKRFLAGLLASAAVLGLTACSSQGTQSAVQAQPTAATMTDTAVYGSTKAPKYVFLFIGDGMSYPQFQAAADYLGAVADPDYTQAEPSVAVADRKGAVLDGPKTLNFMNFDVAGSAITYDSCSFAPDSASTATSIATGHKTYSGMINVDETGTKSFETIAEKLHEQKDWEIGVISSVNLNHATPAAFYAHQASRNNYYDRPGAGGFRLRVLCRRRPAQTRRRQRRPGEPLRPGQGSRLQGGDHPGRGRQGLRRR